MISAEWSNNEHPGADNVSSNADTFHGDLFGDELMDIYHIVTDAGADEDPAIIPNDLSIIQAVLGSTVGTPSGIKTTEDLGVLKSSMSFNDLLLASADKVARMETASTDVSNAMKRKNDEDSSTPSKKAHVSKQGRRSSAPKSATAPQVLTAAAIDLKLDIKMGSNTAMNKVTKEKNGVALSRINNENADGYVETSFSQTKIPAQIDTINAPQVTLPSIVSSSGDKTFGHSKVLTTAFQSQVEGEKTALKSKGMTASLPAGNVPRHSTYGSQSTQDESNDVTVKAEDNFKGVAKAAVLNLIQNACNVKVTSGNSITEDSDSEDSSPSFKKPVDTSTAHIQALTSANWMNACSSSVASRSNSADPAPILSSSDDQMDSKLARSRRASLSADERANLNRDRNREHARNTRLRKKAYVEELKKTLTDLVTQRDASELEKRHEKQRDLEVREVRFRVMEEFLKLRARGSEANLLARWMAILEDGFSLTLPRTDYRQMVGPKILLPNHTGLLRSAGVAAADVNPVNASVQVLKGATECMDDALKLHHFANSLGRNGSSRSQNSVLCNISCDKNNFMMDGVNAFLEWNLATSGAAQKGCISELTLNGYMRATFSPASNKLVNATLHFDTGAVVSQMKSLNGLDNTLGSFSAAVQYVSNPPSDKGESDEESNAIGTLLG